MSADLLCANFLMAVLLEITSCVIVCRHHTILQSNHRAAQLLDIEEPPKDAQLPQPPQLMREPHYTLSGHCIQTQRSVTASRSCPGALHPGPLRGQSSQPQSPVTVPSLCNQA
ncbi:hypothetical protein DFH09DRAFT_1149028 [Mycena vulgaris]|nr:hypothetical protein DFH09DRAFT_1149028 [Mycena vulgaris]